MAVFIDPVNDTAFFATIRRLLGGVDEDVLPDEDITDPSILDMAEFRVLDLIPTYDAEIATSTDRAKVRLATVYVMASLLCPTMAARVDIEVKTIDLSWKRKAVDYGDLADRLMAGAIDLLDNLESFFVGADAKIFAIAQSRRGRCEER